MRAEAVVYQEQAPVAARLSLDWFGQPARYQAEYTLSLLGTRLRFGFRAQKPPQCDLELRAGDFVEGLWESDVAELFLMGPSGRYQELNLSPSGAWWCATFSGYRQRDSVLRCPSVKTSAQWDSGSWEAELSLDLADLPVLADSDLSRARLHVASILDPERPEYLCLGHVGGGQPDFHRAENFLSVVLR